MADLESATVWRRLLGRLRLRVDPQEAEDALHTAYLRLERYREARPVDNPEAFLLRAAQNVAIDDFRRRARIADAPVEVLCEDRADPQALQDEVLEMRNRLSHIEQGLARLAPRTRQVFEMHRLDGYKYREIAEHLGISQSTVEKDIAKAALFLARWARDW